MLSPQRVVLFKLVIVPLVHRKKVREIEIETTEWVSRAKRIIQYSMAEPISSTCAGPGQMTFLKIPCTSYLTYTQSLWRR
jgi:hypothetical protein